MKKIRSTWRTLLLPAALAAAFAAPGAPAYGGVRPESTEFKGYYKNIYAATESAPGHGFYSDLNRLRLEADLSFKDGLSAHIAYDNEVILGTVLDTAEFNAAKDARDDNLFDLSAAVADGGDMFWRQSIHRAYLRYARSNATLTAGRQRVPLGTGLIWNPSDLLDPVNPLQIERGERAGTDALSVDISTGPLSAFTLAYAPGHGSGAESWFARLRANRKGFDVSGLAGGFRGDKVIGMDFSGYAGESGVRGEVTYTAPEEGSWFTRALIGVDHTFPSTLYITAEYLYNGGNDPLLSYSGGAVTTSSVILTRNRNFIGVAASYEVTPLLRFDSIVVLDMDDKSAALGPSLSYNILENLDLSAGVQIFTGKTGSEYGEAADLYYSELQLYF